MKNPFIDKNRRKYLTSKVRSGHKCIVGSTSVGKSEFLERMVREEIKHGRGLFLIDPHGTLCDKILSKDKKLRN